MSDRLGSRCGLLALAGAMLLATTGCQIDVGGQTLPSPWYQKDDIQYFPPGHEFKLMREAAAMEALEEPEVLPGGPAPLAPPAPLPTL